MSVSGGIIIVPALILGRDDATILVTMSGNVVPQREPHDAYI